MPYIGQRPSKGDENNFKILDDISSYTLTFDGSDSSVVSAANDTITLRNHRFIQGQRVTYNKGSGGTVITGLSDGVYYIIKDDHNTIKLATSASNASNGVIVNLTGVGGGSSHTLNVAFDGVNTKFKATHTNGVKAKITRSAQLVISINGVIQQPHDTATPSTGFGFDLDGTIVFSQAPAASDEYWAHLLTNNNVTFDISNNDVDNFTGDGSTTTFNLSKTPSDNRNVLVTIDGVVQYPSDSTTTRAYNVVENVLTFTTAPDSNVEIQVRHIGFAGSTSGGSSGGVTSFYGRTGAVVLKNTDNIVANNAEFAGNLTVQGTMTTLDTKVTEVDQLEVAANNTTVGVAITQSGTGDILNLYDGSSEVFTVTDGGDVGIARSIFHIGDTDTSIGFSADQQSFATNGLERMRIHDSYLVSIGNTNISSLTQPVRLKIHGSYVNNVGPFGILEFKNRENSGNATASIRANRDAVSGGNYSAGLSFHTNYANPATASDGDYKRMVITSTGRVGIGTDTPLSGFHISDGTAYGSPQIGNRKAQLCISAGSETSADIQLLANSYNHILFGDSSNAASGMIVYHHTGSYTDNFQISNGGAHSYFKPAGTFDIKSASAEGNSLIQSFNVRASNNNMQYQIGMYDNNTQNLYINNHKGNVRIAHGGINNVHFAATGGHVGIGSNFSPSRKLDIKDSSGANRIVNIRGTGTSGAFLAFLDANTTDDSKCRIGSIGGNDIGMRGDSHSFQDGNGNNKMVINSSGNAVLGGATINTAQDRAFSIFGTNGSELKLQATNFGGTAADGGAALTCTFGSLFLTNNNTNGDIHFSTKKSGESTTEKMRITESGLVGIGTGNPETILTIAKNATNQTVATIPTVRLTNLDTTAVATNIVGSYEFFSKDVHSNNKVTGFMRNTPTDAGVNYDLTFGTIQTSDSNAVERLRITSDGRLLTGVDTSQQGDANLQVFRNSSTSRITFGCISTSSSGIAGIDFCPSNKVMGSRIECQAQEDFSEVAKRSADLVFITRRDGTFGEKMRINSYGQVGINTSVGGQLAIAVDSNNTNPLATGFIALTLKNTNTTDNTSVCMDFNNSVGGIVGRFGAQFKDTSDKDTDLYFATRADGGSLDEKLRITSTGEIKQYGFTGTSDTAADDLVLGNTTGGVNRGITIWSNSSQNGSIAFADNDSNFRGAVQYVHNGDRLRFLVGGDEALSITATGGNTTITDNNLVIKKTSLSGNGVGGITIGKDVSGTDGCVQINSVKTGSDTDQLGIDFKTHKSTAGSATPQETLRITHRGRLLYREYPYTDSYQASNWGGAYYLKGGWMRFNSNFSNPTKDLVILPDGGNTNSGMFIKVTVMQLDYPGGDRGVGAIHIGYASAKRKGDASGKWHAECSSSMNMESGSNFHGNFSSMGSLSWENSNPSDTNTLRYTANRVTNYDTYDVQVEVWQAGNCAYYLHSDFLTQ